MTQENYPLSFMVNGITHSIQVAAHHTLLQVLRDQLDLIGTKECCGEGECGACTVLLNGRAVDSCLVLAVEVEGCQITTIEGLSTGGHLDPLQQAFLDAGAVQCGFCTPGMIMHAKSILMNNPHPSYSEVQDVISGNLCRCGGYNRIIKAVLSASGVEK